jgi:Subtilase family
MDPALRDLYESGSGDDEVAVIVRLADEAVVPADLRVVARFGPIVTARLQRSRIQATWESEAVISIKAARPLTGPAPIDDGEEPEHGASEDVAATLEFQRPELPEDGTGVVVGLCDWGFDFTHPNFRNADGTTRLRALWDQRGSGGDAPAPYGYGRVHLRAEIDAALTTDDPCATLGYHPASGDPAGTGSHGTHVADILAGNRREPGSRVGLASGAEIVFVQLGPDRLKPLQNFGDSVRLLEGLDFVRREAADAPCVMHLSAGKTGGAHCGETPFEQAVDAMLLSRPGLALVQSAGNYADAAMHSHVRIGPDQRHTLFWLVSRRDRTPNELEIWYSGQDVFDVTLVAPGGAEFSVPLGNHARLRHADDDWGSMHHRFNEPNSGKNHIDIFLDTSAPWGRWRLALRGREVVDGRLHAWIERDARGRHQSRFLRSQATSRYTTNTICNSFRAIAVGAFDGTSSERPATYFSSRGPTADGRQKPELVAPGFKILAARSLPRDGWPSDARRLTVKSGTSMAAPWVSGTVALMFQAAGRPLTINETRSLLIGTADPSTSSTARSSTRLGYGYLNPAAAVAAARKIAGDSPVPSPQLPAPPSFPAPRDDIVEETRPITAAPAELELDDEPLELEQADPDEASAFESTEQPSPERGDITLDEVHEALGEMDW